MCSSLPKSRSPTADPRRPRVVCDGWVAGLMVITLLRAGELLAGEQASLPVGNLKPDLYPAPVPEWRTAAGAALPDTYRARDLSADILLPPPTFRPRGRSILEKEDPAGGVAGAPLIRSTTVWQRLSEYRARDRVRVLTLWETGGNSVSLQAGRRGDPSLQWTSRLMSRGGASHGILDALLSKSLDALVGRSLHGGGRTASADAVSRSEHVPETGKIP